MFDWTCFAVPTIPQLHESTLGMHVQGTDIDDGSFNAGLVCGTTDKPCEVTRIHPSITFDEPMVSLKVHAKNTSTGRVVWDATYNLGSKKELPRDMVSESGTQPSWTKICTPAGATEGYKISLDAVGAQSGPFKSSIYFSSDNAHTVKVPGYDPALPPRISRQPDPHVTVPIRAGDFDPRLYAKIPFIN